MSITDELRKWAHEHLYKSGIRSELLAIADRIDAAYESKIGRAAQLLADAEEARDFNYANWQDCKQKVLQHSITMNELDAEIERLKDELAHRIELPKDADGEYIHIGDRMNGTCPSGQHVSGTVSAIGDGVFWLSNVQFSLKPDYMHHSDKLLPCPFCGGEAQRDSNNAHNGDIMDDFQWFAVYCPTCHCASTPPFDTPSEAIAAWNRRADHD